jgi:RES domain-containing protein
MATLWRIVSPGYSAEILSGIGAARNPGRWNREGEQMIYTAMTQSLAMLERLVYLLSPFPEMTLGAIKVPAECIEFLDMDEQEAGNLLNQQKKSRDIGSGWIASKLSVALAVPSVHIHSSNWRAEPNVLINPMHPDFGKIRLLRHFNFSFDDRLEK